MVRFAFTNVPFFFFSNFLVVMIENYKTSLFYFFSYPPILFSCFLYYCLLLCFFFSLQSRMSPYYLTKRPFSTLPLHLLLPHSLLSSVHCLLVSFFFFFSSKRPASQDLTIRQWTDNLIGTCFIIKNSYDQHYCPYNMVSCKN